MLSVKITGKYKQIELLFEACIYVLHFWYFFTNKIEEFQKSFPLCEIIGIVVASFLYT